jgi:hypothetical protein
MTPAHRDGLSTEPNVRVSGGPGPNLVGSGFEAGRLVRVDHVNDPEPRAERHRETRRPRQGHGGRSVEAHRREHPAALPSRNATRSLETDEAALPACRELMHPPTVAQK